MSTPPFLPLKRSLLTPLVLLQPDVIACRSSRALLVQIKEKYEFEEEMTFMNRRERQITQPYQPLKTETNFFK